MTAQHLLPSTERTLLHRLATAQRQGRAPSLVAGVVRDSALVWSAGYGTVGAIEHGLNGHRSSVPFTPTRDTQYRIGSITKTFIAVAVMRLRDEGLFELSDELGELLPDAAGVPSIARTRIAELLAHGGGLPAETPPPWWERVDGSSRPELADLLGADAVEVLPLEPARQFHYSNVGYGLLGALLGQLRNRPWHDIVRDEILTPLHMERTTFAPQGSHADGWAVHPWADVVLPEPSRDAGLMGPAGQMWSTVDDLARFASFLLDGHEDVLSIDTIAEMRMPSAPTPTDYGAPTWQQGYGLGVQLAHLKGRNLYGHTGSMPGFLATLWCSYDENLASICFANATSGPTISTVAAEFVDIVAKAEPALPPPWRPTSEPVTGELLAALGPWYWGANPVALRLRGNGDLELSALGGAARGSRFRHVEGEWVGLDGYYFGETLAIERDADGAPTHLMLASFVYTRTPYDPSVNAVPGGVDPGGWRGLDSEP